MSRFGVVIGLLTLALIVGLALVPASQRLRPNESLKFYRAVSYLLRQYNADIGLIFESDDPGVHWLATVEPPVPQARYESTYWIYSDNLFAYPVLRRYKPTIAETICQRIDSYGEPPSRLFEVVLGAPITVPFYDAANVLVADGGDYVVMARRHEAKPPLIIEDYADMVVYRALNAHFEGRAADAARDFARAYRMFDGKGMRDKALAVDGFYANYKLALFVYAAKILEADIPDLDRIEAHLWAMQSTDGGFYSLAGRDGRGMGSSNVETTSLALLAYEDDIVSRLRQHRNLDGVGGGGIDALR